MQREQKVDAIENLAPKARPQDIHIAVVIMNACQGDEYSTAKHTLNQLDGEELIVARVVEQLRSVE